jgi:hypothetical protein
MSFGSSTRRRILLRAVSLLCLIELFVLMALAASPGLHELLHHDANKADHHCAITTLAAGKIHLASAPPVISLPTSYVVAIILTPTPVYFAVDYQLLPGRAPPSIFA